MKHLNFFLVLLASLTLIYLVCQSRTEIEGFAIPGEKKSMIKQEIAEQLKVDPGRFKNFVESGDPTNVDQYKVSFHIYPRTVGQPNQPLITEVLNTLDEMKEQKKFFKTTTELGQDIFLSDITVKVKDIIDEEKEAERQKQFINPAYTGQIKYLEDKRRGIAHDPQLDRMHRFEKGEIVLDPEPETITPTPTPTHPLVKETTVPTISVIE